MAAKAFINDPQSVVTEALEGLVSATPHLALLDGFPTIKVVVDASHDQSKVSVISGGGSGHEPAMAGYVGAGMLTAAVCGEVFASPSEDAVLAAIRATTGPAGCLLVVMNYTGDRLNFGAAAERAKAEGLAVEMVVVADDCALKAKSAVGRRGVAGTVLVHKCAGATAASGAGLAAVKAAAEEAAPRVGTMGVSLTECTLFGQPKSNRLGPAESEMGLGIHGEPGAYRERVRPVAGVVDELLMRIAGQTDSYLPVDKGERVALLVNNLGATTPLEMHSAARAAAEAVHSQLHAAMTLPLRLRRSTALQAQLERLYCGRFMTSLDMHGLSLTLMRLDDPLLVLLDAPTRAPAWPAAPAVYSGSKPTIPVPAGPADDEVQAAVQGGASTEFGRMTQRCLAAACDALLSSEAELNALDARVGDGDCGSTLAKGAAAIKQRLAVLPLDDPAAAALALGRLVGRSMGGTSGAVYKILLTAMGASLQQQNSDPLTLAAAAAALMEGSQAVSKYGGAQPGSRTMLDALLPAAQALTDAAAAGQGVAHAAAAAAAAAAAGAEATKGMAATAGRSSYVPEEAVFGNADPGAHAVAVWMAALAEMCGSGGGDV